MQQSAVHIVSGKGGVGKTSVAAALALHAVQRGERVLLCEMNGGDQISRMLGVDPVGSSLREVIAGLSLVDIQPQAALREYVLLVLRFEALYKVLFDNPLVRSFVQAVPALGELVMIGKVWYHAQQVEQGRRRFDRIVVDAPASGHALALLGAPATVATAVPPGPMRDNACLLRDMLRNPGQTCLLPVCLAEDMPVTEVLQLAEGVQNLGIRLGRPIVNALAAELPLQSLQTCAEHASSPACLPTLGALQRRAARQQEAALQLQRLAGLLPAVLLPRLPRVANPAHRLDQLAALLPTELGAA
jgi:anion-transporting  ArsA/GET3 family ATPase